MMAGRLVDILLALAAIFIPLGLAYLWMDLRDPSEKKIQK